MLIPPKSATRLIKWQICFFQTVSPPKGLSGYELEKWEKEHAEREYQAKLEGQRARLEPAFRNLRGLGKCLNYALSRIPRERRFTRFTSYLKGIRPNATLFKRSLAYQKINLVAFKMLYTIPPLVEIGLYVAARNNATGLTLNANKQHPFVFRLSGDFSDTHLVFSR